MYRGKDINTPDTTYISPIPLSQIGHNQRYGIVDNNAAYEPNRSLTRAEFIKMIVRTLACKYTYVGTENSFVDVAKDAWYAEYIAFAEKEGWIE